MAATLPNTVLFYMKTTKLSVTSTLKRGTLLRLHFEQRLTSYSGQTLPVHSLKILWPPKVFSWTKHLGRRPKRWGIRACNRFPERCQVLPLTCFHGLILQSWAGYQTLVSYSYQFIFNVDLIWRPHATVDLCLNHKYKSCFS